MLIFLAIPTAALAAAIAFFPQDWAGWVLVYASLLIIPFAVSLRKNWGVVLAVWIALILHHLIAFVNAYVTFLPGATEDAVGFHDAGVLLATVGGFKFSVGAGFYGAVLGVIYSVFGPSLFLGEETSVFAFALSCIVMVKFLDLLKIERFRAPCILLYGCLPAVALFGSYTMRESWEILFFMCGAYSFLEFRLEANPTALLRGICSASALGLMHNGLIVYLLFLLPYALLARVGLKQPFSLARVVAMGLTGIVMLGMAAAVLTKSIPNAPTIEALTEGDSMEYAAHYRQVGSKGAHSEYGVELNTGSPAALAQSTGLLFIYYMLAPFPWQISAAFDAVAALDAWIRLALLFFAIRAWRAHRGATAHVHRFLLTLYFTMSLLWAMGTVNYGTGMRHHVVSVWIIIILGVPAMLERLAPLLLAGTSRAAGLGRA